MKYDALLIAGVTASGKSAAAMALSETVGVVFVNADSMQVYAAAPVLTARPGADDMQRVPHLLYGHVSVRQAYSVGLYARDAAEALKQARGLGRVPIFTGGTGLYFSALTDGLAEIPEVPPEIRDAARRLAEEIGPQDLHRRLAERDPLTAARLKPGDTQRVTRAWEVLQATGKPLAYWQKRKRPGVLKGLQLGKFVIDVPRPVLRRRIADRFAAMVEGGGLQEARLLADLDPELPASRLLGLKPLVALDRGVLSRQDAVAEAVTDTRQFAKRQMTWFRGRMVDYNWVGASERNLVS